MAPASQAGNNFRMKAPHRYNSVGCLNHLNFCDYCWHLSGHQRGSSVEAGVYSKYVLLQSRVPDLPSAEEESLDSIYLRPQIVRCNENRVRIGSYANLVDFRVCIEFGAGSADNLDRS